MEQLSDPFAVIEVLSEWVLEPQGMGSKDKFWYRRAEGERRLFFKFPQENTGQHWDEKIAAEIADLRGILHTEVVDLGYGGFTAVARANTVWPAIQSWPGLVTWNTVAPIPERA